MNRLIKNELTKIFKKKSIYITLLVILAFVILTNCIYKFFYHSGIYSEYNDSSYIQYIKEELATLDANKPSDIKMYVDLTSQLEVYDMQQKYERGAWQRGVISSKVSSYVNEKNSYLYGEDKEIEKATKIEEEINKLVEKLEQDDWKYFAEQELEQAKISLSNLEEQKANTQDKQELQILESSIENAKIDEEVAKYRLNKGIKYGNDYRNAALEEYQSQAKNVMDMSREERELEYAEKQEYNSSLENREISKYIIENDININKINDVRGILKSFFHEYGLFIIVMIGVRIDIWTHLMRGYIINYVH